MGIVIKTMLFGELRKIHEKALMQTSLVEEALIPVEKIQAAVLLISGKKDKMWPSTMMCEQIMNRLASVNYSHPYQHIAYDAGHTDYLLKAAFLEEILSFLNKNYVSSV
jgi:hypothetical protein